MPKHQISPPTRKLVSIRHLSLWTDSCVDFWPALYGMPNGSFRANTQDHCWCDQVCHRVGEHPCRQRSFRMCATAHKLLLPCRHSYGMPGYSHRGSDAPCFARCNIRWLRIYRASCTCRQTPCACGIRNFLYSPCEHSISAQKTSPHNSRGTPMEYLSRPIQDAAQPLIRIGKHNQWEWST